MLAFFQSDVGFAAAFSAVATVLAVLLGHWLRGRVNLITFSPNSTYFQLQPAQEGASPVHIRSGQVMVQNLGRRSAKSVQITCVPGGAPAGYVLLPSIVHSTRIGPNNEWILEIPFIAPKEIITLQVLNGQIVDSVRCEDGLAKAVPVTHQRLFPRWVQLTAGAIMLFGALSFFYIVGWILIRI
jgi:hypothetical protein